MSGTRGPATGWTETLALLALGGVSSEPQSSPPTSVRHPPLGSKPYCGPPESGSRAARKSGAEFPTPSANHWRSRGGASNRPDACVRDPRRCWTVSRQPPCEFGRSIRTALELERPSSSCRSLRGDPSRPSKLASRGSCESSKLLGARMLNFRALDLCTVPFLRQTAPFLAYGRLGSLAPGLESEPNPWPRTPDPGHLSFS